jgi:uncharacterized protein (TIGR02453 family)
MWIEKPATFAPTNGRPSFSNLPVWLRYDIDANMPKTYGQIPARSSVATERIGTLSKSGMLGENGHAMFEAWIADTQHFVRARARDNTRDWFHAHKADYDRKLREPALALLGELTPHLLTLTGSTVVPKLFRPHRDVRFSKDKTPYKTHLHMMWTVKTGTRQDPALFFGIDAQHVTVATGMMEFRKDVLMDWRKMVDLDGAYIAAKIGACTAQGFELWPPKLKRVPPTFAKNHPHAELLRHKGIVIGDTPALQGKLPLALMAQFEKIWPVANMLIGVAEKPTL